MEEQWNLATESASSGGDRRGAIRWEAAYLRSGSDEGGREKDKENPVGSRGVTGIVALFFFFWWFSWRTLFILVFLGHSSPAIFLVCSSLQIDLYDLLYLRGDP